MWKRTGFVDSLHTTNTKRVPTRCTKCPNGCHEGMHIYTQFCQPATQQKRKKTLRDASGKEQEALESLNVNAIIPDGDSVIRPFHAWQSVPFRLRSVLLRSAAEAFTSLPAILGGFPQLALSQSRTKKGETVATLFTERDSTIFREAGTREGIYMQQRRSTSPFRQIHTSAHRLTEPKDMH